MRRPGSQVCVGGSSEVYVCKSSPGPSVHRGQTGAGSTGVNLVFGLPKSNLEPVFTEVWGCPSIGTGLKPGGICLGGRCIKC